jgi:hypothetical protein
MQRDESRGEVPAMEQHTHSIPENLFFLGKDPRRVLTIGLGFGIA